MSFSTHWGDDLISDFSDSLILARLWTGIPDDRIAVFTSDRKDTIHPEAAVIVTTYTMIAFAGKRAAEAQKVMDIITSREWGLLLMDEVHVVPAKVSWSVFVATVLSYVMDSQVPLFKFLPKDVPSRD